MSFSIKAIQLGLAISLPQTGDFPANHTAEEKALSCRNIAIAKNLQLKWGALSGLSADPENPDRLYAVHDHNLPAPEIYTLDVSGCTADIVSSTPILRNGKIPDYDLEGISRRGSSGFWVASEGKIKHNRHNLIVRVANNGEVLEEVSLPDRLRKQQQDAGFEGIASISSGDRERVAVVFQRPWKDDSKGMVKIGLYWPAIERWNFYHYPLDYKKGVGLSAIAALNDKQFAILERDNKPFSKAKIKRIYTITLPEYPENEPAEYQVLNKTLLVDLLPLQRESGCKTNGKLEGMTVSAEYRFFLVADDDGKGDALLLRLDGIGNP